MNEIHQKTGLKEIDYEVLMGLVSEFLFGETFDHFR